MAITALEQWSTTAASNVDLNSIPIDGAVTTPSQVDNLFRELMAQVAVQIGEMNFEGADIASAATTNLANATGWSLDITGTTTITAFGTVNAGHLFILRFTDALTLTHNATSLILPGAANITTAAGDVAWMKSEGSGNWRCVHYMRAAGVATVGPASSTDNAVARYNGTVGAVQNSGVIIDDSNNITGVAALTCTTFTSTGIDDNATVEVLQLADSAATLGPSTAASTYDIIRQINTGVLRISAGADVTNSGAMWLYGTAHATQAGDYLFTSNGATKYHFDLSAATHTFTGDVTINGTLTVTG